MQRKITKRTVDALKADGRDAIVWDTELGGFGVRCRPSGAKFYVLKFRTGGRQRWITIGKHGTPWTPETARREATRLLGEKAAGQDPAATRDTRKATITVADLGERFLSDYVPTRCKESTAYEYRRAVELFINPSIGRLKVIDLARPDVARFHHELRDKPYQANRALGVLHKMMNMAEIWGLRSDGSNPCRHVKKYKEQKRERFLSQAELSRLGDVLSEADNDGSVLPTVVAAIRLLILTGARLGEVITLEWAHVDFERAALHLPDSKTGKKTIYLNGPALELLRHLPRLEGNPYVITGEKPGARLVNIQKPWRRLRARAGIDDVRIHDLRHSFASVAAGAGLGLPIIGALLGHTQAQTTHRYAHLAADPVRAASDLIGGQIAAAMNGVFEVSGGTDTDHGSN